MCSDTKRQYFFLVACFSFLVMIQQCTARDSEAVNKHPFASLTSGSEVSEPSGREYRDSCHREPGCYWRCYRSQCRCVCGTVAKLLTPPSQRS
uniref:U6-Liphistoxin-Lth1a_1 n=1 Tax=Liphistius thaleban TaxID=1905330 RepID=A0A4Q8K6F0_9ARAC